MALASFVAASVGLQSAAINELDIQVDSWMSKAVGNLELGHIQLLLVEACFQQPY